MKNLKVTFFLLLSCGLFFLNNLSAQSAESLLQNLDQDSLRSLAESSSSGMSGDGMSGDNNELGSVAESDYLKTIQQIKKVDYKTQQRNINRALHEKKVELAIKLCQADKNACYLIEEYQEYKELKSEVMLTIDDLEVFGVDMFSGYPLSFEQSTQSNVPEDYLINVGDNINIAIFGSDSFESTFLVQRDGNIVIPEHGAINIVGINLDKAREKISKFLKNKYIETEVYVSIQSTNTLQVYVLGAIKNPGSYNLSSISKTINAVIATGGFSPESSLRDIKVLRDGKVISSVDFYKLLINGVTNQDTFLLNGDSVMVGARQNTVKIWGDVNRPAVYEFKKGETFIDLLEFSLGFKESANLRNISLQRRNQYGQIETISISSNQSLELRNGDIFEIHSSEGETLNSILLSGAIRNAGTYQFKDGMNLSEILNLDTDLKNDTYTGLGVLKRFNRITRTFNIEEFNLLNQSNLDDIQLAAGDRFYFFSQDDIAFINSKEVLDYLKNNANELS
ncbi:SLBB domain-containing protein, partial [Gammaproteobacteria bacterium]|nr:SLBB domain-containing protein [Gammaproteobacteria bacterium]